MAAIFDYARTPLLRCLCSRAGFSAISASLCFFARRARQVRRANKRAADLRRLREEQLLREAEEAAEPVVIERRPPPAPLAPRSETPQQVVDENGQLPPVRINPAFLPVDAYHGVPRSVVL